MGLDLSAHTILLGWKEKFWHHLWICRQGSYISGFNCWAGLKFSILQILQKKKVNYKPPEIPKSDDDDDLPLKTPQIYIDQLMKLRMVEKKFNDRDVVSEANTIVATVGYLRIHPKSPKLHHFYCVFLSSRASRAQPWLVLTAS